MARSNRSNNKTKWVNSPNTYSKVRITFVEEGEGVTMDWHFFFALMFNNKKFGCNLDFGSVNWLPRIVILRLWNTSSIYFLAVWFWSRDYWESHVFTHSMIDTWQHRLCLGWSTGNRNLGSKEDHQGNQDLIRRSGTKKIDMYLQTGVY